MKKIGIFIALLLLSVLVGETLGSLLFRNGIVLRFLSFEPASADDVARFMAATIMDVGGAFLLAAVVAPFVLYLRKRRSAKLAALLVATITATFLLVGAVISGDAFIPRKLMGLMLVFLQAFIVAYVAAKAWPKNDYDVHQVFE